MPVAGAGKPSGQWQWAVCLGAELHRWRVPPTLLTCGAAMRACGRGLQWAGALAVLEDATQGRLSPDVVLYATGVEACDACGKDHEAQPLWSPLSQCAAQLMRRRLS
mmetsp:Transcript_41815/g.84375  ORF Transcript_41815/g.84375 Transcript_41815/m.84375 type:complete len:107 (-) Transcript_41815:69-389(-)